MTPRFVRFRHRSRSSPLPSGSHPRRPSTPSRAILVLGLLALAGCSESSTVPTPEPPVAAVPTTLEISTDEVLLSFIGGSAQVTARVLDQDGEPMPGEEVLFRIAEEGVATVDGTGLVTAAGEGLTRLDATSGSLIASADVDVRTGWVAVAAGREHACGLWGHGVPFCWGDNSSGQLGLGPEGGTGSPIPAPVDSDILFRDLALGDSHGCGLAITGEVLCWGWNAVGQLGTGDVASRDVPSAVETSTRFVELTVGAFHSCALTEAGAAVCWGGGGGFEDGRDLAMGFEPPDACSPPGPFFSPRCSLTPRPVEGGTTFSQISAGLFHTCAVGTDGRGWCWGWNRGQLGNGENHDDDPEGTEPGYAEPVLVSGALTLEAISAGNVHSCGVTTAGDAWCWGEEEFQSGALGSGDVEGSTIPVQVDTNAAFAGVNAAAMNSVYNQFTCGTDNTGSATCWGANRRGQLGATSFDSCAVEAGQIPCSISPVPVDTDRTFDEIALGLEFTCGLGADEGIWCWGANNTGQLGNGGGVDRTTPVRVTDPPMVTEPEPAGD